MIELNKVMLMARLTRDPETRYLPSGSGVCEMRVAADRSWVDRNSGERHKETLFITVKAWAKLAEFCQQYMRKGSGVYIEGRLQMETWKDKQTGQDRERISILADRVQFGETKAEAEARMSRAGGGATGGHGGYDPGDYDAPPMNEAPASHGGGHGGYGGPSGPGPSAPPPRAAAPPREAPGPGTHDDLPF